MQPKPLVQAAAALGHRMIVNVACRCAKNGFRLRFLATLIAFRSSPVLNGFRATPSSNLQRAYHTALVGRR